MDSDADLQLSLIFSLLLVYQLKHYIADFPLQREYMLRKTTAGWGFLLPLATHCSVHALGTLLICFVVNPSMWWLSLVDFGIHFIVDRLKSGPKYFGKYNDITKPSFWNILGLDQMLHHTTHLGIVWILVQ